MANRDMNPCCMGVFGISFDGTILCFSSFMSNIDTKPRLQNGINN